jgi:hypothetical protein
MTRKTEPQDTPFGGFDPFADFNPFKSTVWGGTAWFENLADMGSELSSFLAERIKEDVKTQHALLNCRSMKEVHHVQAEFLQTAIDQYQAETGKLVEMTGDMSSKMRSQADKQD